MIQPKLFRRQVLVVILADLRHGRVGAGAEAFDLFPGELAIRAQLMRALGDLVLADGDQILRPADHAGRRAADLDMGDRAHGRELEHEVEGRDLKAPDMGKPQHVADMFDRGAGQPTLLLLRAPQKRDDRRGLPPLGVLGDLRLGPFLVGGREGEAVGLLGVEAAEHGRSSY
jgi:hypothetical protein